MINLQYYTVNTLMIIKFTFEQPQTAHSILIKIKYLILLDITSKILYFSQFKIT